MKNSFILYTDQSEVINALTNEQAGKLVKAFFDFNNDKNVDLDPVLTLIFIPFKQQFLRNSEKWEAIKQARAKAGRQGGLANAKQRKAKQANATFAKQKVANQAVSVSDSVSVINKETEDIFSKDIPQLASGENERLTPAFYQGFSAGNYPLDDGTGREVKVWYEGKNVRIQVLSEDEVLAEIEKEAAAYG